MPANLNNPFDPSCCDGGATSDGMSTQPCGCDPGANYYKVGCHVHNPINKVLKDVWVDAISDIVNNRTEINDEKQWRKERPVYSGVLAYFPDAILEVAYISFKGNEQHNPGEPLHWAREKSTDQLDCVARHLIDHAKGISDDNGMGLHLAKVAWRALAELQIYIENKKGTTI